MTAQAELARRVNTIRWFHRIDLGNGIVTPGEIETSRTLARIGLPDDLRGKTVLDIGAWDGYYSFECERRGAERVVALDHVAWSASPMMADLGWPDGRAGFDLAREALRSRVEPVQLDLMEIGPELGEFDVVLCLGVLYHLRDPMLALERISSVVAERLILQTHTDLVWVRRPAAAFYPQRELGDDPTNWWGPNAPAVTGMLAATGFSEVTRVWPRSSAQRLVGIAYRAGKAAWSRVRRRSWGPGAWAYGNVTFHALK